MKSDAMRIALVLAGLAVMPVGAVEPSGQLPGNKSVPSFRSTLERTIQLGLACLLGISLTACVGVSGFGGTSWKEEVLLHDGQKIVVERSVERGGRHEIGQKPPFKWQRIQFTMPGTGEQIEWVDNFSEDIGTASFLPMLLDIQQGNAYLVANTMGCLSYNKWGRPNPPYVIFKYENQAWTRVTLQELPAAIKTPNLIQSEPDATAEQIKKNPVPAETIREVISRYPQPEYRNILREVLPKAVGGCEHMVHYKCGWFGIKPDGTFNKEFADRMCNK